ncbi:MAG: alpha/beta hydrolase [Parachlamydiales bacterium]|nr:alpha/beta hydrolase [Parachlamydiales bacterium]
MCVSAVSNCCHNVFDTIIFAPIRYIAEKVRKIAEAIFGYLLRIVTFQMGEMRVSGAYYVMRMYQKLFSYDPREEKPFDPQRLEQSKNFLLGFGGTERRAQSADGGSNVHFITFKSADFFAKFAELGSHPIDITYEGRPRRALLDPPEDAAAKFYFPIVNITMLDGTIRKGALLPERCASANPPHILNFHSPGRSMCMDRRFVGQCLAAGYDVTISDQRGTAESTGIPSEGGYYLDAEAVYLALIQEGIQPNQIYASGFCEGAAIAAHIKQKYHAQGVHFIASNPYTSMREVVEGYGCLGRMAVRYGEQALKDPNIEIPQDCFDNELKLRNLPHSEGKCIFIHTDTDNMMPHGSVNRLIAAFDGAGPVHEILRIHPNRAENGHLQPPYEDPLVWRRFVEVVT